MGGSRGPATITILFEGRPLPCRPGASVAVALWERGVRALSHSPRFGRPRGLFCARGHCTSCLMRIDGVPNVRACLTPVRQGMQVERQDAGGRHGPPLQRLMNEAESLFPPGFYFKWFTRPAPLRRLFLGSLRPLTGIGHLPDRESWDASGTAGAASPEAELGPFSAIVVGAGAWGMIEAARLAARGGARAAPVLLVDDHPEPGGQRRPALAAVAAGLGDSMGGLPALQRAEAALEAAAANLPRAGLELALGWRTVGAWRPGVLLLHDGDRLRTARAPTIVWAAGALDRLGLFPGNDLPGLFGPRGIYRAVVRDGMQVGGLHAVVCGGGLDVWLAAALLAARGARVTVALADLEWTAEAVAAPGLGLELHLGQTLREVRTGAENRLRLRFAPAAAPPEADAPPPRLRLGCDLAVVCERGKPAYDLPYQLGCELRLQPGRGGYLPAGAFDVSAGAAGGAWEGELPGGVRLRVGGEALGLLPAEALAGAMAVLAGFAAAGARAAAAAPEAPQ